MFDECKCSTSVVLKGNALTIVEDVEHASAPAPETALAHGSLPPLQYEGFEPSPYDQDDARADIFQVSAYVARSQHLAGRPIRIKWT